MSVSESSDTKIKLTIDPGISADNRPFRKLQLLQLSQNLRVLKRNLLHFLHLIINGVGMDIRSELDIAFDRACRQVHNSFVQIGLTQVSRIHQPRRTILPFRERNSTQRPFAPVLKGSCRFPKLVDMAQASPLVAH